MSLLRSAPHSGLTSEAASQENLPWTFVFPTPVIGDGFSCVSSPCSPLSNNWKDCVGPACVPAGVCYQLGDFPWGGGRGRWPVHLVRLRGKHSVLPRQLRQWLRVGGELSANNKRWFKKSPKYKCGKKSAETSKRILSEFSKNIPLVSFISFY